MVRAPRREDHQHQRARRNTRMRRRASPSKEQNRSHMLRAEVKSARMAIFIGNVRR